MKLTIALAAAAGLLMGIANAQTVTTENAAGYAKVTIASPGLELLANPFDTFDGSVRDLADELGDTFPQGSAVHRWNPATQTYISSTFQFDSSTFQLGWSPQQNMPRGQGFFLEVPPSSEASYDWYAHGQVPYSGSNGSSTPIALDSGLTMTSLSYPVARAVNSTDLNYPSLDQGDSISAWDDANKQFVTETFQFNSSTFQLEWSPGNYVFTPGKGVFFDSQSAKTWTQNKSDFYNWPN